MKENELNITENKINADADKRQIDLLVMPPPNTFENEDCMKVLPFCPDNYFDLAIVDPPCGIGFSDYERESMGKQVKERYTKDGKKKWDYGIPDEKYFNELFRVSKNCIVWGATISSYQAANILFFGIRKIQWIILQTANMLGLHLRNQQSVLNTNTMEI